MIFMKKKFIGVCTTIDQIDDDEIIVEFDAYIPDEYLIIEEDDDEDENFIEEAIQYELVFTLTPDEIEELEIEEDNEYIIELSETGNKTVEVVTNEGVKYYSFLKYIKKTDE
jgi:hypothetical protein